ncbi:MAG: TRAP transporter small permease subunit [Spongiibacteraceae bacterium]
MQALNTLRRIINQLSDFSGRTLGWMSLVMMLLLCLVVILRYVFHTSATALQELVTYFHASIFMLGLAYTFKHDGHVRVDIFYRNFSPRGKAWVNSLGGIIFLLPLCIFTFVVSWGFVEQSWQIGEVSSEPGGIPLIFLLKALIPLMSFTLGLQALADIIDNAMTLTGLTDHHDGQKQEDHE